MTFWHFIQAHYVAIGLVLGYLFKHAANALPPAGQPFQFGQWFMAWMRGLALQVPDKFPPLSVQQQKVLAEAGVPAAHV